MEVKRERKVYEKSAEDVKFLSHLLKNAQDFRIRMVRDDFLAKWS